MYKTHYRYLNPSPAGPYVGHRETDDHYAKGEEIYGTMGRAIVTGCRKIKARDDAERPITDLIGDSKVSINLEAIARDREILQAMSLEDLRNMPYAYIRSLLHGGFAKDVDAKDLFHATEGILREANKR